MTDIAPEAAEIVDDGEVSDDEADRAPADDAPEDGLDPDAELDDEDAEEPVEEIEHDGKKYKIPAALKPAIMKDADYTKKTQELADQRKAFEASRVAATTADKEYLEGRAKLIAIDDQLKLFEDVDWDALEAQDAARANALWRQRDLLKDGKASLERDLGAKDEQRALDTSAHRAKAIEEGWGVLARDIKGWNADLAGKVASFAEREFGVSKKEMAESISDPRIYKAFHRLHQLDTASKTQTTANRVQRLEAVRPTPQVGKGGAAATRRTTDASGDKLSTAEWMRREDAREASLRKRN